MKNKPRFHLAAGLALCAALWALTASPAQAGNVTYTFVPLTGVGGSVLSGSITVNDADDDGYITQSEIVSWAFQSTGSVSFSMSSADSGASFQDLGTPGGLAVTPTTLSFNFGSTVANNPFVNFSVSDGDGVQFLESAQGGADPVSWGGDEQSDDGSYGSNVIATAVPEPSTSALTLGSVLAGFVLLLKRRRARSL